MMNLNSEEFRRLKSLADRYEVRFNPREDIASLRDKIAVAVLENEGDTIHAVEILFGKDNKDFNEEENRFMLGFHILHNEIKRKNMQQKRDTYYGMSWKDYNDILFEHGFDKVLSYNFKDTFNPSTLEEYSIFVRKDRGFLLTAESYGSKKTVNSTMLYFELNFLINGKEAGEIEYPMLWNGLERCSSKPCLVNDKHVARSASRDAREGFVGFLSKLETLKPQLNSPWEFYDDHFLWLLDYSETKEKKL